MVGEGEREPVPISALQHYLYCPRQCALIHIERAWEENAATAEGRLRHETAHMSGEEVRRGVHTVTAMPLRSVRLNVAGIADVVELRPKPDGGWLPYPVEYKRGRPKTHRADEVQLCAQAMALEEMFRADVPKGALFYGALRRRNVVAFDEDLRELTTATATAVHRLLAKGVTPRVAYEKRRCDACSLLEICRPRATGAARSAAAWLLAITAGDSGCAGS